jgi:acyl-CoA thioesterase
VTAGLGADTALEPLGDGRWRGEISERWWILHGPYGGYVSAFLVRALEAAVGDPARRPRSLTVHFLAAPQAGPVEVGARVERTGGSTTAVSLRMEQGGATMALALASAAVWREGPMEWDRLRPPDVPAPEDCPPARAPEMPPFTRNFDVRWAAGEGGVPYNATWVRPVEPAPLDALMVTALSDTLIPVAFTALQRLGNVPTVDLTVHFRSPLPPEGPDEDGWALAVFHSGRSSGGVWEEDGELWSRGGVLLSQSRQLALMR